jgi:8-oxo-dGTP pyrophosphatase MutT (NUDIX family)
MTASRPDALLYVAQKAFVQRGSTVLILNDPNYGLDFPGGKIQLGELDLAASLRREVLEETCLEIEVGRPSVTWIDSLHPLAVRTSVPVVLIGYRCRHVSGEVRLSDEHDGFAWMSLDEAAKVPVESDYHAALRTYCGSEPT